MLLLVNALVNVRTLYNGPSFFFTGFESKAVKIIRSNLIVTLESTYIPWAINSSKRSFPSISEQYSL